MIPPVEIPVEALSADALQGLIEEFVTRDGTDYGFQEVSLETKIQQVKRALQSGDAHILFDEDSQSAQIFGRDGV